MNKNTLVVVVPIVVVLALGCQQAGIAKTDRSGVHCPPVGTVSLDGRPSDILHYRGRLYVTSFHDSRLWVVDATSGRELGRFENFDHYAITVDEKDKEGKTTGQRTENRRACVGGMAIAGGKLFVEQIFCDSLLVLDADTLHPVGRIKTAGSGEMIASPDGKKLYFASNSENRFSIIDVNTYEQKEVAYPEGGHGIGAIAVSPDGKRLYLGIQRGARDAGADAPSSAAGPVNPLKQGYTGPFLAVYDLAHERYAALKSIGDTLKLRGDDSSIPNGDDSSIPSAFAMSPDERTLYIAMGQCMAGVHVFDTVTNELRTPITFASTHKTFPWPNCSGVACRDGRIYVTVSLNYELVILDARTHHKLQVIPLGGDGNVDKPRCLALSSGRLFVCHPGLRRLLFVDLGFSLGRPSS